MKKIIKMYKRLNKYGKALLFLILVMFAFSIGVFAKYIISRNGTGSAEVDNVYYSVVSKSGETLEDNIATFYFDVNNYNGDLINQVLMKYYLKINGLDSSVISDYKLYYKDASDNWQELSKVTTGEYTDYFLSSLNLEFGSKKSHSYKLELILKEDLLIATNYNFNVDIKLVQTQ